MDAGGVTGYLSSYSTSFSRPAGEDARVTVPVRPAHSVFAQYRHVSGVPASLGQRSVPLPRLQILDSLISNLRNMGVTDAKPSAGRSGGLTSGGEPLDILVQEYASSLHNAVTAVPLSFGTLGASASAGMVFSVTA